MTSPRDPDSVLDAWLDEGPTRLPEGTRRTINAFAQTSHQARRPIWSPWRASPMLQFSRVAIAAIAVVAAVGSAVYLSAPANQGGTGGGPSPIATTASSAPPSPSLSPIPSASTDPLDTSAWVTYASARYGFYIGHPKSWTERPATRAWSFGLDSDVNAPTSAGADHFTSSDGVVRVSAWDVPLESSVDLDSREQLLTWINDYCTRTGAAGCTGIRDRAVFFCNERRDCHNAYLVSFGDWIGTFAWGGSIDWAVRIVAVWRSENDPQVAPYGGTRALLEAFLSTMNIVPAAGDQLGGSPPPAS